MDIVSLIHARDKSNQPKMPKICLISDSTFVFSYADYLQYFQNAVPTTENKTPFMPLSSLMYNFSFNAQFNNYNIQLYKKLDPIEYTV